MTLRTALATLLVALPLAASPAAANPYDVYFERQRGRTVILEHTPAPRVATALQVRRTAIRPRAQVRRVVKSRRAATVRHVAAYRGIAGGCSDGGNVTRVVAGRPVLLQREVCRDIEIRLTGPYLVR
jgi:hypothetical protein